ncbi:MAG: hypothetical protein J1E16_09770 [Muribaculaceae bacterium]|nr:hypothetical protein [Muribaculaceae bacterium]
MEEEISLETVIIKIELDTDIKTRDNDSYSPETDFANTTLGDCQISRGSRINTLYYKVFEVENNEIKENEEDISSVSIINIKGTEVTVVLDRTKEYKILFWAQHNEDGLEEFTSPYILSSSMEVTVEYDQVLNNDERLDAFYGSLDYHWKEGITPTSVTLYRPLAQVNVGSIIADWLPSGFYNQKMVRSKMTISNVASKFSIATGKVIQGDDLSKYEIVFNFNSIFNGPTQDLEYLEPEERDELSPSFRNAFLYVDFNENGKIDQAPTVSYSEDSEENFLTNNPSLNTSNSVDWWRYERSRYISMAYFLVDSDESLENASDVVDVRFSIGYNTSKVSENNEGSEGNEDLENSESAEFLVPFGEIIFDNVAVRPNYRTNIVGTLFSKQQRIFVNLSPLHDGIFTNLDEENSFDDSNRLVTNSKDEMKQEGYLKMIAAFKKNEDSEINTLFEQYGFYDEDRDVKCFVLADDVEGNDILQVRWDYMLYGNGHTVKLFKYGSGEYHYNLGPVRNIYLSDDNGNYNIYIDDNGYVWFLDGGGKWTTLWYQLQPLDGSINHKSYDINCLDGKVTLSNHYPN